MKDRLEVKEMISAQSASKLAREGIPVAIEVQPGLPGIPATPRTEYFRVVRWGAPTRPGELQKTQIAYVLVYHFFPISEQVVGIVIDSAIDQARNKIRDFLGVVNTITEKDSRVLVRSTP